MDTQYCNAFNEAVVDVFSMMLDTSASLHETMSVRGARSHSGITGIVSFTGSLAGIVTMTFSTDVAMLLVERFAGTSCDVDDPSFADAIGELVNMVAGSAKAKFDEPGVQISCPSVVIGTEHRIQHQIEEPHTVFSYHSDAGVFTVGVTLKKCATHATTEQSRESDQAATIVGGK